MSKWLYQQLNWSVAHRDTHKNEFLQSNIKMFHWLYSVVGAWTLLNLHWRGFRVSLVKRILNESFSFTSNWTRSCVFIQTSQWDESKAHW